MIARAATSILIVPTVFDFGWVPDNALVRAEFHVKNTGEEMVPLTAVQPSCGCTATDFTPEGLPSAEEAKINLTFNTRGYSGMKFDKPVKVKAGMPEEEFSVRLTGHVSDPEAVVAPEGDGVVAFSSQTTSKSSISIKNNSDKPLKLQVIQDAEGWVDYRLPRAGLPAKGTATIDVEIKGPLDQSRQTSATFEAGEGADAHRFTIAFRTGEAPEPYRKIRNAPRPTAVPTATPTKKH